MSLSSLGRLQFKATAQKHFRADRIAEYAQSTIVDKEVGAVHYDEDKECMYLGALTTSVGWI
jgi:hypothetical protein